MLHQRILSSIIGIPLLLFAVWYGGWLHFLLTIAIMIFALFELNKIFIKMNINPPLVIMTFCVFILSISAYIGGLKYWGLLITPVVLLFLLMATIRYPAMEPKDWTAGLTGTLYVGMFVYFYLVRTLDGGITWIFILLFGTWAGDTLAYVVGKKLGRRKLAPELSPGKTVEGALGGLMGSLLGALLTNLFIPAAPVYMVAVLGLLVGAFGILGDLFESSLKRTAGIKDTGVLIPGHGGVLDRFDSMLFAAPVTFYFVYFMIVRG